MVFVEVNGYTIEPGANLAKADFPEANLREANLDEAVFRQANLIGVDLTGARSGFAHWPKRFDRKAAGGI